MTTILRDRRHGKVPQYQAQTDALGRALVVAIAQQGAPNRFGCTELVKYGGPSHLLAAQIMRRPDKVATLELVVGYQLSLVHRDGLLWIQVGRALPADKAARA